MTWVLLVLLWVVCGGIAAFLGWTKGRSVGAWFFCGLLLGPIGVIAAALARDQDAVSRTQLGRHL
jgi:hypothetical protein